MKAFLSCLFVLWLAVAASAAVFSLQATVTVNPEPIGLDVEVDILTQRVYAGEDLLFLVELSKEGSEEITVDLKYEIVKRRGWREEIIASETDSMQLVDYAVKQASIQAPADAKPGTYKLRVTASYFNQSDVDEDSFKIKKGRRYWWNWFFPFLK